MQYYSFMYYNSYTIPYYTLILFIIRILGDPVAKKTPKIVARAGQQLLMTCPISGYPIFNINWEKGIHPSYLRKMFITINMAYPRCKRIFDTIQVRDVFGIVQLIFVIMLHY